MEGMIEASLSIDCQTETGNEGYPLIDYAGCWVIPVEILVIRSHFKTVFQVEIIITLLMVMEVP